ncbi:MAG: biotin--protein ligase [Xanthomonadales bacterium]|nr:biotin--protein ligase [Xanthomonadales bacterium]
MHGEYKVPGGKLVVADVTVRDGRMLKVQISGDFFLEPDSVLADIDRALVGLPVDAGEQAFSAAVEKAMAAAQAYGITAQGVAVAVVRALNSEHPT